MSEPRRSRRRILLVVAIAEIAVVAGCDVYEEGDLNFVTFTVTAGAVVAQPHVTG